LKSGDIVNGDARIIDDNNLEVDESSLTGESISVIKNSHLIEEKELVISECSNIVFSGTMVTNGVGKAIIYAVGGNTEIGKIALAINESKEEKTPLEESLDSFSKYLALGIILICIGVFILNVYRNMKILDALMFAVALAVAAIPEALSTIVTIVLAIGTQKMAQEKAIVKQLKAVEGLGCVNVICTDKTGTLTENKMKVDKVNVESDMEQLLTVTLNIISKNKKDFELNVKKLGDDNRNNLEELVKKHKTFK
jgi:Ca2+-transporting ATPase